MMYHGLSCGCVGDLAQTLIVLFRSSKDLILARTSRVTIVGDAYGEGWDPRKTNTWTSKPACRSVMNLDLPDLVDDFKFPKYAAKHRGSCLV